MSAMSLFRKPKKRFQRRALADDEDENAMEVDEYPSAPPPPMITEKKPKDKPKTKALLSFGDEDEETEVFRVKKSSHSKKLQRQLDRERKNRERETSNAPAPPTKEGNGETAQDVPKTDNSRNNDHSVKPSYEGLILSGRDAVAAGATGDVLGSGSEESDEENGPRKMPFSHAFRPSRDAVRAMLDRGVIPDAATIHAARKTRQKAREITGADYVALRKPRPEETARSTSMNDDAPSAGSGRLVREDGDGDGSDEDAERIEVRGVIEEKKASAIADDAPRPGKGVRRKDTRKATQGSDPDSGGDEWEAQQIRKAVTGAQIMAAQNASAYYHGGVSGYAMPPTYSDIPQMPGGVPALPPLPPQVNLAAHLMPLLPHGENPNLPKTINALKERIQNMKVGHTKSVDQVSKLNEEMVKSGSAAFRSLDNAKKHSARYKLYQKLRGYFTDLLECLDEKLPLLESLEQRSIALRRKQSSLLAERRRADVRDQAQDALLLTAKPGTVKPPDGEEKTRRAAEREGRRQRRRRARELAANASLSVTKPNHRDGDSSDDEIPQADEAAYAQTEDLIREDALRLFSDALPSYSRLRSVLARASLWRNKDRAAYNDAFVADCLPKLVAPYVRMELLLWNPIAGKDDINFENMAWYRSLMVYSVGLPPTGDPRDELSSDSDVSMDGDMEDHLQTVISKDSPETLAEDADTMIIPKVIAGVIVPKLAELIEASWEPLSNRGTARLISLLHSLGNGSKFPGIRPRTLPVANALTERLASSVSNDVFVPVLPRSIIESRGGAFFNRQVNSANRLLKNSLRMQGVLSDAALERLVISQLLDRYLVSAVRCCPPVMGAELCHVLVSSLPAAWKPAGNRLPKLIDCMKNVKGQLQRDNPLHMKALDQLKTALGQLEPENSKQMTS